MFKSAYRFSVLESVDDANVNLALATACITFHVALTAAWAGLLGDMASMLASVAVTMLLAYRLFSMAFAKERARDDLVIVAATLAWSAWVAYRNADLVLWIPSMLIALFMAPQSLIVTTLAAGVLLTGTASWLASGAGSAARVGGLALAIGLCTVLYRLAHLRHEAQLRMHVRRLQAIVDSACVGFIEIDEQGKISMLSDSLLTMLGAPGVHSALSAWRMLDLFHPDDHLVAARAGQCAAEGEPGTSPALASCDCRLLQSDGNALWVHARFMRPMAPARGTIATFLVIEERKRMERALFDTCRRLDAQDQELAAQFEVSKNALHARQEVERLAQHDLKSPLKSIAAAASMLRSGRKLSISEESLLTSIERTAGRALAIVSMSLDLYRMEEGTFRFVPEIVDLAEIGRRVIEDISLHARTKNVRIEFAVAPQTLRAVGNEVFITSVVENLVRNAVEAAPEHSAVHLSLRDGVRVGLLIHNEGAVPEEIRQNFFEKYVTHGKRDGLGLGTYSARLIARAQGGELRMSSAEPHGTTLTLELQKAPDHDKFSPLIGNNPVEPMHAPPRSPALLPDLAPVDLLVVEDDEHNWLLLSSWLPAHIVARRAINGRDAVDALVHRRPDLVVMDLEMPVMNGFEALRQVREMQSLAGEKASTIVAFTGYDDVDTLQRIHAAGFDGVLSKPVTKAEFEALIASISEEEVPMHARKVWVEKQFADAFPAFIESRRALVRDIERAAAANDMVTARRAAHTLAGSPAIHEFDAGVAICRKIVASHDDIDASWLALQVEALNGLLADPSIR